MVVAFTALAGYQHGATNYNPNTIAHEITVAAGQDLLIVVCHERTDAPMSTCSWDGDALTHVQGVDAGTGGQERDLDIFVLEDPEAKTADLTFTGPTHNEHRINPITVSGLAAGTRLGAGQGEFTTADTATNAGNFTAANDTLEARCTLTTTQADSAVLVFGAGGGNGNSFTDASEVTMSDLFNGETGSGTLFGVTYWVGFNIGVGAIAELTMGGDMAGNDEWTVSALELLVDAVGGTTRRYSLGMTGVG